MSDEFSEVGYADLLQLASATGIEVVQISFEKCDLIDSVGLHLGLNASTHFGLIKSSWKYIKHCIVHWTKPAAVFVFHWA